MKNGMNGHEPGPSLDYEARRRAMDREYQEAWAKLSPAMLAKMARMGINGGKDGGPGPLEPVDREEAERDLCREDDAAVLFENSTRMSTLVDFAGEVDRLPWLLRETFGLDEEQAEGLAAWHLATVERQVKMELSLKLNRVIGFFLQPGNLLVRAHALAHAARMAAISGLNSLRHSSKICGVSVEAVRKVAWRWVELLELPALEGAKSAEAKEKYRQDKLDNHWRSQTCDAESMEKL